MPLQMYVEMKYFSSNTFRDKKNMYLNFLCNSYDTNFYTLLSFDFRLE
jgi:hypothetical protein